MGREPAGEIEAAVIGQLHAAFRQPEIGAGTARKAREHGADIADTETRDALTRFDPLWDALFPAEQTRIAQLLVERVEIGMDSLTLRLRVDGLRDLAREMLHGDVEKAA